MRRAIELAQERGASAVFVLGASHYYGRLGFDAAAPLGWRCTYEAPEPAFRVRRLGDPAQLPPTGHRPLPPRLRCTLTATVAPTG